MQDEGFGMVFASIFLVLIKNNDYEESDFIPHDDGSCGAERDGC